MMVLRSDLLRNEYQSQLKLGLSGTTFKRLAFTTEYPSKRVDKALNMWLTLVAEFGASLTVSGRVLTRKLAFIDSS